jgi:hypothetical protein
MSGFAPSTSAAAQPISAMATEVIVHHLAQAKAVLKVARKHDLAVKLRSHPGAAAYAGVGFLKALGDAAGQALIIDCDDDPGLAMAALRSGSRELLLSAPSDVLQRVEQIAAHLGGHVRGPDEVVLPLLVLSPDDDETDISALLMSPATS